jgi:hypothetical protein
MDGPARQRGISPPNVIGMSRGQSRTMMRLAPAFMMRSVASYGACAVGSMPWLDGRTSAPRQLSRSRQLTLPTAVACTESTIQSVSGCVTV